MRHPPPKRPGYATGPRRLDGALLDVASVSRELGQTEKATRAQIARGLIPARRRAGRIVVLREELMAHLRALPRVVEL